ncbi:ABC transporter permease [Myxococcota bacterium]|nr:ABC transporter permease [Myxococcota bacterium]
MSVLPRASYFLRTALRGLRSNPVTTLVAMGTIAVSLLLFGSFALLLQNMQSLLDRLGDELYVTAFFEQGLPSAKQRELAVLAATVEGVEGVRIVSETEALERFRDGVGSGAALLEGLSENPLPASLEIALVPARRSAQGMAVVAESLNGLRGIEDLVSGEDWVEGYLRSVALVRGVCIGLGLILSIATMLIVANTIRLAIYARRDELEILSLVGASRSFMQTPFLLEGVLQGASGGVGALVLLFALFRLVLPEFEFGLEMLLGGIRLHFFGLGGMMGLVAGGGMLGLVGSVAALTGGWRP